ncbi:MAG TPA: PLP-dependent aminotransferase family protein [Longimicrobium sp.]|nr:PLP-dependent aminotransferase family protein [Longimicrobium sp.]
MTAAAPSAPPAPSVSAVPPAEHEIPLARWARESVPSALQSMLTVGSRPGILSLGLGLPAPELFPAADLADASARVLAGDPVALQYSPPFAPLKRHVVELMARRGVRCSEEQVFLTAGGQQGMSLLTRLLLDPGGTVLLERLCYTGLRQAVEPLRPRILSVGTDPDTGIDVDAVEAHLAAGERPAFIYVVTDGNNPLAVSVSMEKRVRLVELAREYGVPILEDDAYGFFQYVDDPIPPMRALDDRWVLYMGTFSKIFAPAMRAGWLVVPPELVPRLGIIKEATDINTSVFTHRVISSYIDQGLLPAHLELLRREYGARRDAMLEALAEHFPPQARWRAPAAGVFVWVELPEGVDAGHLLGVAVETEQVAFLPGNAFGHGGDTFASNCMRLNFSHGSPERVREGVARLGRVIARALDGSRNGRGS